jgi:hypothetical protein
MKSVFHSLCMTYCLVALNICHFIVVGCILLIGPSSGTFCMSACLTRMIFSTNTGECEVQSYGKCILVTFYLSVWSLLNIWLLSSGPSVIVTCSPLIFMYRILTSAHYRRAVKDLSNRNLNSNRKHLSVDCRPAVSRVNEMAVNQ